jgi:hypothetical protein
MNQIPTKRKITPRFTLLTNATANIRGRIVPKSPNAPASSEIVKDILSGTVPGIQITPWPEKTWGEKVRSPGLLILSSASGKKSA